MKGLVATLALALATAGSAAAGTQTSIIERAAAQQAASEQWKVTCKPSGPSVTCAFYDPSEPGAMNVDGKKVQSEGQVRFRAVKAHACQFDVLNEPSGVSSFQLEGQVDVCQPAWQLEVWPVGKR